MRVSRESFRRRRSRGQRSLASLKGSARSSNRHRRVIRFRTYRFMFNSTFGPAGLQRVVVSLARYRQREELDKRWVRRAIKNCEKRKGDVGRGLGAGLPKVSRPEDLLLYVGDACKIRLYIKCRGVFASSQLKLPLVNSGIAVISTTPTWTIPSFIPE